MIRTLILTGPHAGKTIRLRNVIFRNGKAVLNDPGGKYDGIIRYMNRSYQAFEEGSEQLLKAQERDAHLREEYAQLCHVYGVRLMRDRAGQPDPFCKHAMQLRAYHLERTNGQCDVQAAPSTGPTDPPPGHVLARGPRVAAEAADELSGDADAQGGDPGLRANRSVEHGTPGAGAADADRPSKTRKLEKVTTSAGKRAHAEETRS